MHFKYIETYVLHTHVSFSGHLLILLVVLAKGQSEVFNPLELYVGAKEGCALYQTENDHKNFHLFWMFGKI